MTRIVLGFFEGFYVILGVYMDCMVLQMFQTL